jgi:hypothetical protein
MDRYEEAQKCCTVGLLQLEVAKQEANRRAGVAVNLAPSRRSRPMLASQETFDELCWKAFVRRGRAYKGELVKLGGLRGDESPGNPVEADLAKLQVTEAEEQDDEEEHRRAEERGRLLLAARSDFAAALRLDPLDDVPRQELATLIIDPLQRVPSGQDISKGLALSSISQLHEERKRNSQEVALALPVKPRRSESS